MVILIRYKFSQRFPFAAKDAFAWCTSFDLNDHALIGDLEAIREVNQITSRVLILKDTFSTPSGMVEKQKLVHLYPNMLTWTSTHLSGPNKHSQFLYEIVSSGKKASTLHFTANHLEYNESIESEILAHYLRTEDSDVWKRLTTGMKKELGRRKEK